MVSKVIKLPESTFVFTQFIIHPSDSGVHNKPSRFTNQTNDECGINGKFITSIQNLFKWSWFYFDGDWSWIRRTTTANVEAIWNRLAMDGNEANGWGNKSHTSFFLNRISLTSSAVVVSLVVYSIGHLWLNDPRILHSWCNFTCSFQLRSFKLHFALWNHSFDEFKFKFNCFAFTTNSSREVMHKIRRDRELVQLTTPH